MLCVGAGSWVSTGVIVALREDFEELVDGSPGVSEDRNLTWC